MSDQAQGLRSLARHSKQVPSPMEATASSPKLARTIAITGGKGGVGKSCVAANMALLLAQAQHETLLFDADLGLANAHLLFGVQPELTLDHLLREECALVDTLLPVAPCLHLLSGATSLTDLQSLSQTRQSRFAQRFRRLDSFAETVIIDTGAGLSPNVTTFLSAVEEVIVVTIPEIPALADAYATIKTTLTENPLARIHLLVNRAKDAREALFVGSRIQQMTEQFLNRSVGYLGFLPQDPSVPESVRQQVPFVLSHPNSQATRQLLSIVQNLGANPARERSRRGAGAIINTKLSNFSQNLPLEKLRARKEQEIEAALWNSLPSMRSCLC